MIHQVPQKDVQTADDTHTHLHIQCLRAVRACECTENSEAVPGQQGTEYGINDDAMDGVYNGGTF